MIDEAINMRKKQFKTESKKMLDMMINSIYTHDEIFLRELISNASDAIDKRSYRGLTDESARLPKEAYEIRLSTDEQARTLTVSDNGIGMTGEELEQNLGTIARSGSMEFKRQTAEDASAAELIGQFGVGFYAAFMVSDRVTVTSRAVGEETGHRWTSEGAEGYSIEDCDVPEAGTSVTLHLKEDTDDARYSRFLESYTLRSLVKKYSDYIRWPIRMEVVKHKLKEGTGAEGKEPEYEDVTELETFNSMVPLWHRSPKEVKPEEYDAFYRENFYDYDGAARVLHSHVEGTVEYEMLLFVPKHAPFNYYTREHEKGLRLYSNGVMIMEKCADLLPDYFSFVRGLVDSSDFTLNISREVLQHDGQLKLIARTVEKKIKNNLAEMMQKDREAYEGFFKEFGLQLKFGVYSDYGTHREVLQDLLLYPAASGKMVSLKEYVDAMPADQKCIYYACGESREAAAMLPQTAAVRAKGYDVLLCADDVDEFALQVLRDFEEKPFTNVCSENLDLATEEEKKALEEKNESEKDLLKFLAETLGDEVSAVRFTNTLGEYPVCLANEGGLSAGMQRILEKMPGAGEGAPKAQLVLEINMSHPVAETLKTEFASDKDAAARDIRILYAQARLISGLPVNDPAELSRLVCSLMTGKKA